MCVVTQLELASVFAISCIKVNVTLEAAVRALVEDFNQLAEGGLQLGKETLHFFVISIKGDWAFLRDLWQFNRSWSAEEAP